MLFSVLKHFWEYSLKNSLLSKKKYLRKKFRSSQKVFFSTSMKRSKFRGKLGFAVNNPFWSKQQNGTNIKKNCFSLQNVPQTTKLCFSFVLKHFRGNFLKTSLFSQKMTILERSSEILRKITFLNKFEKEKSQRNIWIWCKQLFLFKAVKWDNY